MSYRVQLNKTMELVADTITDLKQMSGTIREAIHIDMPVNTDIEALKQMVGTKVADITVTLEKGADLGVDLGDVDKGNTGLELEGDPVSIKPGLAVPELDASKGYRVSEVRRIYSVERVITTMILLV